MIVKIVLANGSARARPNRWMGGRPGPHAPSEVNSCTPPLPRDHVGKKRRAYVHDQVGGWGRVRQNEPPPTPSEVMPRYDP